MRYLLVSLFVFSFVLEISAAVVVLSNVTGEPVDCTVKVGDGDPEKIQLAVGESRPVTCGRAITLSYTAQDGVQNLQLEPYTAYLFEHKKKTGLEFKAAGLIGNAVGVRDIPMAPPQVKPVKVFVKLLVDDAERRTKQLWTAELKKRLAAASDIMMKQAGVVFEFAEADEWTPTQGVVDFNGVYADFAKQVDPKPGNIAIGFTSREYPAPKGVELPFAANRGMFGTHILLREGDPRTEPERVEVLVQQLGRWLGAVASPDPISVMRPKLGDGKAIHAKFRIGFDPLNLLAINIAADEVRKGSKGKLAEWPQEAQVRLARIYGTLAAVTPEEPMNDEVSALLDRAGLRMAGPFVKPLPEANPEAKPDVKPEMKPRVERALNADQEAIRKVVKAVVLKADENSRKPASARIKGDALTELYIRAAAETAYGLENELRKKAFLIALGVALDDSEIIRNKPIFGDLWKAVESDDERKSRLLVLGNPTLRQRRDWCQHFVISASLTALGGAEAAELMGLEKEKMDMTAPNGSGFSFADLAADYAGVALAAKVLESGENLNALRSKFTVETYLPKIDDLPEGLSKAKFEAAYGSTNDKRFKDVVDEIRKRVKELKK